MNTPETKQAVTQAVILEKLNHMHDDSITKGESIDKRFDALDEKCGDMDKKIGIANGKTAKAILDIALLKEREGGYIKRTGLGKILWGYVTAFLLIIGSFSFIFAGWFENRIQKTIRERLSEDISVAIDKELQDREFIINE